MRTAAIAIVMSVLFFFVGWWSGRRTASPKSAPATASAPVTAPAPVTGFNTKAPRRDGARKEAIPLGVSASLRLPPLPPPARPHVSATASARPRAIPHSALLAAIQRQAAIALPCFSDEPTPPRLLVTMRFTPKTDAPQVIVATDSRGAARHGERLSSRVRACAERALGKLSFGDLKLERAEKIVFSLDVADRLAADASPVAAGASKP